MNSYNQRNQIYSYAQLYSEYFFHKPDGDTRTSPEYTLIFVFSGELTVNNGDSKTNLRKGEYIFLRRDSRTILVRSSYNEETFSGAFLGFHRSFLCEFYRLFNEPDTQPDENQSGSSVIKITRNPYMDSMYLSLLPYLDWKSQPSNAVLEIKLAEAVFGLLQTNRNFYNYLFGLLTQQGDNEQLKLYTIGKEEIGLCLFGLPRSVISGGMEASYIRMKKAGKTSDIYFEVSYPGNRQIITLHGYYNNITLN